MDSADLCELFEHKIAKKLWIKQLKVGKTEKSA